MQDHRASTSTVNFRPLHSVGVFPRVAHRHLYLWIDKKLHELSDDEIRTIRNITSLEDFYQEVREANRDNQHFLMEKLQELVSKAPPYSLLYNRTINMSSNVVKRWNRGNGMVNWYLYRMNLPPPCPEEVLLLSRIHTAQTLMRREAMYHFGKVSRKRGGERGKRKSSQEVEEKEKKEEGSSTLPIIIEGPDSSQHTANILVTESFEENPPPPATGNSNNKHTLMPLIISSKCNNNNNSELMEVEEVSADIAKGGVEEQETEASAPLLLANRTAEAEMDQRPQIIPDVPGNNAEELYRWLQEHYESDRKKGSTPTLNLCAIKEAIAKGTWIANPQSSSFTPNIHRLDDWSVENGLWQHFAEFLRRKKIKFDNFIFDFQRTQTHNSVAAAGAGEGEEEDSSIREKNKGDRNNSRSIKTKALPSSSSSPSDVALPSRMVLGEQRASSSKKRQRKESDDEEEEEEEEKSASTVSTQVQLDTRIDEKNLGQGGKSTLKITTTTRRRRTTTRNNKKEENSSTDPPSALLSESMVKVGGRNNNNINNISHDVCEGENVLGSSNFGNLLHKFQEEFLSQHNSHSDALLKYKTSSVHGRPSWQNCELDESGGKVYLLFPYATRNVYTKGLGTTNLSPGALVQHVASYIFEYQGQIHLHVLLYLIAEEVKEQEQKKKKARFFGKYYFTTRENHHEILTDWGYAPISLDLEKSSSSLNVHREDMANFALWWSLLRANDYAQKKMNIHDESMMSSSHPQELGQVLKVLKALESQGLASHHRTIPWKLLREQDTTDKALGIVLAPPILPTSITL